ncbi:BRCT domain protein, partial [Reticulomyxa filosa]
EQGDETIEALQQKYDTLKQVWKDKELEWLTEKSTLENQLKRLQEANEQVRQDHKELESELGKLRSLELEHYKATEDQNLLTEQMVEIKDDARRVHEELEQANQLTQQYKQQLEQWKDFKKKQMEEHRALLNQKQDLIQQSKRLEIKLASIQNKFEDTCEKYNQTLLQISEMQQAYDQQMQLQKQQLDTQIANASSNFYMNDNIPHHRTITFMVTEVPFFFVPFFFFF